MNKSQANQEVRCGRRGAFAVILQTGFIAGTLDITDSLVFNHYRGITPTQIFHYIASGLIGMKAFRGGVATTILGLALHYTIAYLWTILFYAASRKVAILIRRPLLSGLLYGAGVYLFMNLVVLPLSAVPQLHNPVSFASRINGVLAVVLFIGLTISLLVRRNSEAG